LKQRVRIILYIICFILILINLCGCKKNEDENALKEKINTEISYIDSELVSILNGLNNINYSKYKVMTQEIQSVTGNNGGNGEKQKKQGEGQQNSSKQSSEDRNAQESGDSSDSQEEGNDSSNSKKENNSSDSASSNKIYSMQANNLLGKQVEIDWNQLRNKIENLYTTWTVVSLDLKTAGVNEEELNNFVKVIDRVAIAIKAENKEETISSVIDLYSFLPPFIETYNGKSKESVVLDAKYKLLVCYKYTDLENWEELDKSVEDLKMSFSNIVNMKESFQGKQVNIRSGEVILKEIENSVEVKDRDIFFIKYKNFIQELNIILSI